MSRVGTRDSVSGLQSPFPNFLFGKWRGVAVSSPGPFPREPMPFHITLRLPSQAAPDIVYLLFDLFHHYKVTLEDRDWLTVFLVSILLALCFVYIVHAHIAYLLKEWMTQLYWWESVRMWPQNKWYMASPFPLLFLLCHNLPRGRNRRKSLRSQGSSSAPPVFALCGASAHLHSGLSQSRLSFCQCQASAISNCSEPVESSGPHWL